MNQTETKSIQAVFAMAGAALVSYLGAVVIPLAVLMATMIVDYATGMVSAWHNHELSSRKGVFGIVKKISYLALVCVGMGIDWLLYSGLSTLHVQNGYTFFFGALVCCWLIINELISILENLGAIGVPLPTFLVRILKRLKQTVDKKGESEEKVDDEGD